jgi:hypothetical protein
MRIADLNSGAAKLLDAADALALNWNDAKEFWRDENARNVEENHLRPIGEAIKAALGAIHRLAEVLDRAQRECESW